MSSSYSSQPNYAEIWSPKLLEIKIQESLTSPFIVPNVKWLGARTFHFTQMAVSGFKTHLRDGSGFNKGRWVQNDVPYTVMHTRDISFFVDKADVDETNYLASAENIAMIFQKTQAVPELDALFFERVAQAAINGVWHSGSQAAEPIENLYSTTKVSAYTNNAVSKIKSYISKIKKYRPSLICYVSSAIMDKLETSTELQRKIEMVTIPEGGIGIETRYTSIDGVPILECWEDERFYSAFNYNPADGGFEPQKDTYAKTTDETIVDGKTYYTKSDGTYTEVTNPDADNLDNYYEKVTSAGVKLNVVLASLETVITVPKINSIYFFPPGTHLHGDGYVFATREDWDTFVFPNGKNNKIDSVYVDLQQAETAE